VFAFPFPAVLQAAYHPSLFTRFFFFLSASSYATMFCISSSMPGLQCRYATFASTLETVQMFAISFDFCKPVIIHLILTRFFFFLFVFLWNLYFIHRACCFCDARVQCSDASGRPLT